MESVLDKLASERNERLFKAIAEKSDATDRAYRMLERSNALMRKWGNISTSVIISSAEMCAKCTEDKALAYQLADSFRKLEEEATIRYRESVRVIEDEYYKAHCEAIKKYM